jgi:hypothetical protein
MSLSPMGPVHFASYIGLDTRAHQKDYAPGTATVTEEFPQRRVWFARSA